MNKLILLLFVSCLFNMGGSAQTLSSPDKQIEVSFSIKAAKPVYTVLYQQKPVILESALGVILNKEAVTHQWKIDKVSPVEAVHDSYTIFNAKKSNISYQANKRVFELEDDQNNHLNIEFKVADDGIAFRYVFPDTLKEIQKELTTYHLATAAKAWLQPKAEAKTGFEHTNPSYEEYYQQAVPPGTYSRTGWVYPALFKTAGAWLVITEAGMDGSYCGTLLYNEEGSPVYHVAFPDKREIFTGGSSLPEMVSHSPWRVIAIGSLNKIMESTLGTDMADKAIPIADQSYIRPGQASWSWIMSKDDSITYTETKRYIDFAHRMNWEYCLIDADWDTKIGYDEVKALSDYAKKLDVGLLLWYNSAGDWNTVKMTPKDKLLTAKSREQELQKLKDMGIKGIKVDFFGGDGQSMIRYYTDILKSAAKYQLLVNFHGATLPRGWARTYPNLMSTEAVNGFEMITFSQWAADHEANHVAMLPFTRNIFDPMDFTPMNLYKIPGKVKRKTTGSFELATSILLLSGIQHYAESPSGMTHVPQFVIDFLRELPGYWDDVRFIDGYPGKYAVIARKGKGTWYVAGINGEHNIKKLTLDLSSLPVHQLNLITDDASGGFKQEERSLDNGQLTITLQPDGGFVLKQKDKNEE